MAKPRYRRTQILVDKKFQLGISMKIIVCLACYLVLFCLMAVFSPFLVLVSGTASEETIQAASTEILVFVKNLLLPLTLTFTCLALHCILMSHRIAGPAYRINRTFEAMRDGDLSIDMHLRNGDYLTDIADAYNDMIAPIRRDVGDLKEMAGELVRKARAGEDGVAELAEEMDQVLSGYRVSREEDASEAEPETGEEPAKAEALPGSRA